MDMDYYLTFTNCLGYVGVKFSKLYIYTIIIFSKCKVPCINLRAPPLRIFIRKVWKKEDVDRLQYPSDYHLQLVLLLQLIPHIESHECAVNNGLFPCFNTQLLLAIRGKINI